MIKGEQGNVRRFGHGSSETAFPWLVNAGCGWVGPSPIKAADSGPRVLNIRIFRAPELPVRTHRGPLGEQRCGNVVPSHEANSGLLGEDGPMTERPLATLDDVRGSAAEIAKSVAKAIEGKPQVVRTTLTVLLAEGHLLIEDVPGVGKTMLAKALARSIDCTVRRIQFTPDLLPSDVTGVSVFNQNTRDFEFKPGSVFANIVVGDEINRASPKTQSALLECMEERQVTVDGTTYVLEAPFMVIATQNPIEMEGTYPLPEAQRDRFMARVSMGYPDTDAELAMLDLHGGTSALETVEAVTDAVEIRRLVEAVRTVHLSDSVRRYVIAVVSATRRSPDLRLGASPRAALHLVRAARASAALDDRDYVSPDDIQRLAVPVLAHRLLLTAEAQIARRGTEVIVNDIMRQVPLPNDVRG